MVDRQPRFAFARAATAGVCSGMLRRPEINGRVDVFAEQLEAWGARERARERALERETGRESERERYNGEREETRSVHM